ncbi:hypothetical protein ZWY2020_008528 [Hordeum vulgare]|nr:hypothetical protein ZWY2020_008528 [Hordeum vulgare]
MAAVAAAPEAQAEEPLLPARRAGTPPRRSARADGRRGGEERPEPKGGARAWPRSRRFQRRGGCRRGCERGGRRGFSFLARSFSGWRRRLFGSFNPGAAQFVAFHLTPLADLAVDSPPAVGDDEGEKGKDGTTIARAAG